MKMPHVVAGMLLVSLMVLGGGVACGQNYPSRPIRIITSAPGGGADLMARIVAQGLSSVFGQQAVVDNRGGNVTIPAENLTKAPPDGHTLLVIGNTIWLLPFLQEKVPYDPVRDLLPITLTTSSPAVLAIHPSLPVKSVKDLIALAKARPGELNYASGSIGSTSHLGAELFKTMAGVNIVRIPYQAAGPAVSALVGGQVQLMFAVAGSVVPYFKSNRLRAVAVASSEPSALTPGLPTLAASGLAGYESSTYHSVFAPVKTPAAIIARLNQEIVQFINRVEIREKLFNAGLDVVGSSPEQTAATIKTEMTRMGKIIRDAALGGEK